MTQDGQDPRATWDRLSGHYDRQRWLERSAVRFAVELLAAAPAERCLDVGTGTGEVLRALRRGRSRPREVIGIDASPAMLAQVGRLPVGWAVGVGDVRALPFQDSTFDAISASYLLHPLAVDELPVALAEIRRVLRPGGRLVTVTPAIPAHGLGRPIAAALDSLSRRAPARYRGLRALDPRSALEQAGFPVAEARRNIRGYPSICVLGGSGTRLTRVR